MSPNQLACVVTVTTIYQSNVYSANIPVKARLSGATAESVFNSKIDRAVPSLLLTVFPPLVSSKIQKRLKSVCWFIKYGEKQPIYLQNMLAPSSPFLTIDVTPGNDSLFTIKTSADIRAFRSWAHSLWNNLLPVHLPQLQSSENVSLIWPFLYKPACPMAPTLMSAWFVWRATEPGLTRNIGTIEFCLMIIDIVYIILYQGLSPFSMM